MEITKAHGMPTRKRFPRQTVCQMNTPAAKFPLPLLDLPPELRRIIYHEKHPRLRCPYPRGGEGIRTQLWHHIAWQDVPLTAIRREPADPGRGIGSFHTRLSFTMRVERRTVRVFDMLGLSLLQIAQRRPRGYSGVTRTDDRDGTSTL